MAGGIIDEKGKLTKGKAAAIPRSITRLNKALPRWKVFVAPNPYMIEGQSDQPALHLHGDQGERMLFLLKNKRADRRIIEAAYTAARVFEGEEGS